MPRTFATPPHDSSQKSVFEFYKVHLPWGGQRLALSRFTHTITINDASDEAITDDIFNLEVAVHESTLVQVLNATGDLLENPKQSAKRLEYMSGQAASAILDQILLLEQPPEQLQTRTHLHLLPLPPTDS